nr:hypothetical protein CFP56_36646 [Quercus suber]
MHRSWKKLVTLDNLHTFCGGLVLTDEGRRLDVQSIQCKCLIFSSVNHFPSRFVAFNPFFSRDGSRDQESFGGEEGCGPSDQGRKLVSPRCQDEPLEEVSGPWGPPAEKACCPNGVLIIKDPNLDECLEHEMDALGDSSLFDLMRAFERMHTLKIRYATKEAVDKCLGTHLGEESDQLKKYKEGVLTLNNEVKALTEQVKKLNGATRGIEELMEANAILTAEMTSLRESINKAKANVVKEYKDSQPFFNLVGSQYREGFEDFKKQATVLFPNMDFSHVQIKLTVPPTPKPNDEVVEVDDGEGDIPENVVAPQVVEGDSLPQVEEATVMRRM